MCKVFENSEGIQFCMEPRSTCQPPPPSSCLGVSIPGPSLVLHSRKAPGGQPSKDSLHLTPGGVRHTEKKRPSELCRDGQVSWGVLVGAWFSTVLFTEREPQVSPPPPPWRAGLYNQEDGRGPNNLVNTSSNGFLTDAFLPSSSFFTLLSRWSHWDQ